jgi:hypothetical protein
LSGNKKCKDCTKIDPKRGIKRHHQHGEESCQQTRKTKSCLFSSDSSSAKDKKAKENARDFLHVTRNKKEYQNFMTEQNRQRSVRVYAFLSATATRARKTEEGA